MKVRRVTLDRAVFVGVSLMIIFAVSILIAKA